MNRIKIGAFFIDNFRNINEAVPATVKLISAWKLGMVTAIFPSILESLSGWYVENTIFMSFVCLAIFLDHLAGSYVHAFISKTFSWRKNRDGLFRKIFSTVIGYVLLEMLHQIVDDVDFIAIYLKVTLQAVVFLYPASSALGNLHIITEGKMPPSWLMLGVNNFEKDGNLSHFKTTKKTNNEKNDLQPEEPGEILDDFNNDPPRD